jgi:hypothetical protein
MHDVTTTKSCATKSGAENRATPRTERELPNCAKFRMLRIEPKRVEENKLMELPNFAKFLMLIVDA